MSVVNIRPVTIDAALDVAQRMRPQDVAEMLVLGYTPEGAVVSAITDSDHTFVGYLGDEPVAVFGLKGLTAECGSPWMLGTPSMDKAAHRWMKPAMGWVEWMQSIYPVLTNIAHKRNTRAIRWLKHMGFIFLDTPVPGQPDFIQFVRYRNV